MGQIKKFKRGLFVCCFRCWDDDENGVVLWIIKGPILLTVLVSILIFPQVSAYR